jgi:hypothetical protein
MKIEYFNRAVRSKSSFLSDSFSSRQAEFDRFIEARGEMIEVALSQRR